jgi:hypothetical protein
MQANAQTDHSSRWGLHGMAVFGGNEGLYASHLPMFHSPHDVQLVFRFHLQDAAINTALRNELANKPALWTLEPEKFDLNRFAPWSAEPLKQFTARFVQGHFERGGTERHVRQTVVIDDVIMFRRLLPASRVDSKGHYHVVGKGRERFLVKEIDRHPDFDIIVALAPLSNENQRVPAFFTMPTRDLGMPSAGVLSKLIANHLGRSAGRHTVLYFETDDLK